MARFNDADWLVDQWLQNSQEFEGAIAGVTCRLLVHDDHPHVLYSISGCIDYTRAVQLDMILCTERYQGHASRFMQQLCEDCDAQVLPLTLQAAAFDCELDDYGVEPLGQGDLVEWYEGFGFERHDEGLGETGYWMRRMPVL